ncbi:MAG: serine/threonine-protein kinase, partial [Planctomycetota bacterium]
FLRRFPKLASFLTDILGKRLLQDDAIHQVGKYKLIGELGRGGMSIVYEGLHPSLSKTVAIKMLSHELVYESDFSERFKNEAKIIGALDHENIVQVYDQEKAYGTYFIIMEKIKGTVLSRLVETRGVLPFEQVRSILRQMAVALDYAHEHGVIHRDVKPANVIIEPTGRVKLMDFGIAKSTVEGDAQEDLIGTAEYMSPEQIMQMGVDGRADIYSLGVMGWEMLVGRVPFECPDSVDILRRQVEEAIPSPRSIRPEVPADLDEFVTRATLKDPDQRFATCRQVVELLSKEEFRASLKVDEAKVKVLTLVYDPSSEDVVRQLVEKMTAASLTIPGMRFGVSDARLV